MADRLGGKTVLVVGGTSGIGLSAAVSCVREGARVAVTGRDPKKIEQAQAALGRGAWVFQCDARESQDTTDVVAEVVSKWGSLDGLYHVAGGSGRSMGDGPLHQITDEGWEETLRLNLNSVFYSNRAAVRQFLSQGGGGCIVNMASVLGFSPSPTYFSTHTYATAKAAIIGLSTATASYYAPQNIRINVIAPGLVETPMARRAADDAEIQGFIRTKQPLDGGRMAVPTDYDGAALFLLSDESAFMTGQTLVVDGGWTRSDGQIPRLTKEG